MWLVPALVDPTVPMPPSTPIPCLVCSITAAPAGTFAGTVQSAQPASLAVFNGKTHQTMGFVVPAGFHNVESSDGKISGAPVTRAAPGLLARVSYRSVGGDFIVTHVLLLTIEQCRSLMAAERITGAAAVCPD